MEFVEVISFSPRESKRYGHVPDTWRQGRTAYGGVLAAAAVRAMAEEVPEDRVLRTFMGAYVGPVGDDEVSLEVPTLNAGGTISTLQADFASGGVPAMQLTAVFGSPRFSTLQIADDRREIPAPEGPSLEGLPFVPQFTANMDYRWLSGGIPFTGHSEDGIEGLCRHRTDAGAPIERTIGLLDAWPAPVLPLLRGPAPASTVTWSAHFYPAAHREFGAEEWWFYASQAERFEDGYVTMTAKLYAPDGELAAWCEQLVLVYEKAR